MLPGGSRWGGGSGKWKVADLEVLGATTTLAWQMLRWGGATSTENSHWGEIWRLFVNVNENVSCDLQILSPPGLGKEGYKGCLEASLATAATCSYGAQLRDCVSAELTKLPLRDGDEDHLKRKSHQGSL